MLLGMTGQLGRGPVRRRGLSRTVSHTSRAVWNSESSPGGSGLTQAVRRDRQDRELRLCVLQQGVDVQGCILGRSPWSRTEGEAESETGMMGPWAGTQIPEPGRLLRMKQASMPAGC